MSAIISIRYLQEKQLAVVEMSDRRKSYHLKPGNVTCTPEIDDWGGAEGRYQLSVLQNEGN